MVEVHRMPRLALLAFLFVGLSSLLFTSPASGDPVGTGTISGTVTGADDKPVEGVCVSAFDSEGNGSSDETDASGEYSIGFMSTRDYWVLFSRCANVNVLDEWYGGAQTKEESTPVAATDGVDTPGIDAKLAAGGSLSGKALLEDWNGSHHGTCVRATGPTHSSEARTDADGNYRVLGLKTGNYKVFFERCNPFENIVPEFYPDAATSDDATSVPVTLGQDTPGVDVQLGQGGSITGRFRAFPYLAPVVCYSQAALYDSQGRQVRSLNFAAGVGVNDDYRFDVLRPGEYRVRFEMGCMGELDPTLGWQSINYFRGKGTLAEATPVRVVPGTTRTGINNLTDGGASISGKVTDESGNPLDGICVDSYDSQGNWGNFGRTGPDGSFLLDQFTAGNFRLKFSDCLDPDSALIPEYYDDKPSLGEAVPIQLEHTDQVSGIDVELKSDSPKPEPPAGKARLKVKVKGPAWVRRAKRVVYRVTVSNTGSVNARQVKLKVNGSGVRYRRALGKIKAGGSRTVKVRVRPKKSGKARFSFKVTSANARPFSLRK